MITLLLANTDIASPSMSWNVVTTVAALAALAANLFLIAQRASGKGNERQIEPTEMHAITVELRSQTATLNKLDREAGAMKAVLDVVKEQVDGLHARTGAISRDLAATAAKVDGLEKREGSRHA